MITEHQGFQLLGHPTFEKVVGRPPLRMPVRMPNEACFYYILDGQSRTYGPDGRIEQPIGEGLVLQCGHYVTEFLRTSTGGNRFEAIAIHLHVDVLKLIYDKDFPGFLDEVDRVRPLGYERHKSTELLTTYIESLRFYFENPELVSDELQKLKIKELLLLLARTEEAGAVRELISSLFCSVAPNFKSIIEANLYEPSGLADLAGLNGMSLSTFKREFNRRYQQSPGRYIRGRRLEKAAQLLRKTDLRVSDVAFDCGFQDLAHFSRLFSKEYGLSPTKFRERG